MDKTGPSFLTESNIASMGSTIDWVKSIGLCSVVEELSDTAKSVPDSNGVVFVPSLGGLPAPFQDYSTDAGFMGLSLRMSKSHMVRAVLEGLAFQIRDLYEVAQEEGLIVSTDTPIIADGGVSNCEFLMQQVSSLTGRKIVCPVNVDTTAIGTAYLAGIGLGFWDGLKEVKEFWQTGNSYLPQPVTEETKNSYVKWRKAMIATVQYSSKI